MPSSYVAIHPELSTRLGSYLGVPVREDTAYTNHKGVEKDGVRKRAQKAIEKLQDALRKALQPEEVVLYLAAGQVTATALEQVSLGWHSYYTGGGVLVFTVRRLLHFQVGRNGDWKRRLRSAAWGDVEKTKVTTFFGGTLRIRYKNGTKENYWQIGFGDARKMKILFAALLTAGAAESSPAKGIVSLCPDCLTPLTAGVYRCGKCGLDFKDEKTAFRRSLLIPGGGYFYTGHPFLALAEILFEVGVLVLVVITILAAMVGSKPGLRPGQPPSTPADALIAAAYFALLFAVQKFVTIRHCRRFVREFIPVK